MSTGTLYAAIRARLDDQWTACPVAYENESFIVPEDIAGPLPWMMVEITASLFQQQTIGAGARDANRWMETGQLWLHVFAPANTGSIAARALLRQAVDLFRGSELGTTTFLGASIGLGERAEVNGTWWRISAAIDFQRDE